MHEVGDVTPVGTILGQEEVFRGHGVVVVNRTILLPDSGTREQTLWVRPQQFVVAVVTDTAGNIVAVRESKFGKMEKCVSCPTGGIKKNETALQAAIREFADETGYTAEGWQQLPYAIHAFLDKVDGGEHFIVRGHNATHVQEPRGPDQEALILPVTNRLVSLGNHIVPAHTITALAYCGFRIV